MQLSPEQLGKQLDRLFPVYLLYGDEPLQLIEAADRIRQACRRHGFEERQFYSVLPGFNWNLLAAEIEAGGLFSRQRLLEVQVPEGKIDRDGARVLARYAERPPEAAVLLLRLENLPLAARKSEWFMRLEALGVAVQAKALSGQALLDWLASRARSKGLALDQEALCLLAARTEGNLLAAAQEIDKLYVLYGPAQVDARRLSEAVADSARFDVFALSQAWLAGEVRRVDRILSRLRAEGVAPAVVLWALALELRRLLELCEDRRHGVPFAESCRRLRLWDRRQAMQIERALGRFKSAILHRALQAAAEIDAVIKGQALGDSWAMLREVCLALATAGSIDLQKGD